MIDRLVRGIRHTFGLAIALLIAGGLAVPPVAAQIMFRAAAQASASDGSGGITHVGAGADDTRNNCGDINPSIPGGSAGDILIALVNARENGATVTMPGWNTLYADQYPGLTGNQEFKVFIFWRFATGGDPNTVTQSGTCNSIGAQIARFSGVDSTQPFENLPIPAGNVMRQNSGNLDTGTETTTVDGAMILVAGFINDNRLVSEGGGWSQSFDTRLNVSRDLSLSVHYQPQASAGSISVSNWDLSGVGTDENYGIIFALRPATAGSGLTINVPAGTVANDVMIASVGVRPCSNTNGGACTVTVTPPAGWTAVNSIDQPTGGGTGGFGNRLFVYQRVASGAEPANYAWVIGGAPQHAGAVGAIAGFSGVDTASPIVVEAGQATPNSYNHTAPSINTSTEANTMLVSTHTANSAATWAPPGGMTEAADVASLPVPN
ncbi:MAG: hypothetical protein OEZ08_04380, partial [Betaproteobacteria bacterium]|nr:hypothetical protein [Betaproteobacteria bacterium]